VLSGGRNDSSFSVQNSFLSYIEIRNLILVVDREEEFVSQYSPLCVQLLTHAGHSVNNTPSSHT